MVETTDPATAQPAADAGDLLRLTATAAALIEGAVVESLGPVATLGSARCRLTAAMPADACPRCTDLIAGIQSLQLHDRLVPHLIEVRDALAQTRLMATSPCGRPGRKALGERWRAYCANGRDAIDPFAPRPGDRGSFRVRSEEGAVELL